MAIDELLNSAVGLIRWRWKKGLEIRCLKKRLSDLQTRPVVLISSKYADE